MKFANGWNCFSLNLFTLSFFWKRESWNFQMDGIASNLFTFGFSFFKWESWNLDESYKWMKLLQVSLNLFILSFSFQKRKIEVWMKFANGWNCFSLNLFIFSFFLKRRKLKFPNEWNCFRFLWVYLFLVFSKRRNFQMDGIASGFFKFVYSFFQKKKVEISKWMELLQVSLSLFTLSFFQKKKFSNGWNCFRFL